MHSDIHMKFWTKGRILRRSEEDFQRQGSPRILTSRGEKRNELIQRLNSCCGGSITRVYNPEEGEREINQFHKHSQDIPRLTTLSRYESTGYPG